MNIESLIKSGLEEVKLLPFGLVPNFPDNFLNSNKGKTFVFIHGYPEKFIKKKIVQQKYLSKLKNIKLLFFNYNENYGVKRLSEDLKKFLEQNKEEEYYLIGHSLGGLITRYYIEFLEGKNNVKKTAIIATPNHGTLTAYFARGQSGKDMRPESGFLKELNSKKLSIPYLNIWTNNDEIIIPNKNAKLKGAYNVCILNKMHLSVLANKTTYKLLDNFFHREDLKTYPENQVINQEI